MTDDSEPPMKIVSRRKSRPKGPRAQIPSSQPAAEPKPTETNLGDLNIPSPLAEPDSPDDKSDNYAPEPAVEAPTEPVPDVVDSTKPEEPENNPVENIAPLDAGESFVENTDDAVKIRPLAEEDASPISAGKRQMKEKRREKAALDTAEDSGVEIKPLSEEGTLSTSTDKKGKKAKREKKKKKAKEESTGSLYFEEESGMKRLSRKDRKELKQKEEENSPNAEIGERKKGFSVFRFTRRRTSIVKAKAEIEENQRKLFGTPRRTDPVSIQKMTQPISRRMEYVTPETTAPNVPGHMKVALALFRDYYTLRPVNAKLEESLRKSKMPYSTVQYQARSLLFTIIVACVGSIALGVAYYFIGMDVLFGIPVVVLGATALYWISLGIPGSKISKRRKNIEARLPMALAYIATMASADIPVEHIMYELGKTTEYGEIAKEARAISASSRLFGNDIITALREEAKYSPSVKLSEFLSGITSTVTSGGSLKDYFTMKAKQFQSELSTLIKQNAESVGVLAESYVTVGVAFPLMFIVILGVLVAMTPNSGPIVLLLYLMVLMMIPLITFVFAFIIQSSVKEVPI